jgi:N-acetylmuramoyl-L-alanine amidase
VPAFLILVEGRRVAQIETMRRLKLTCHVLALMLMDIASASAGVVTLAWDANSEPNIAGYVIAYGTSPGNHPTTVNVGNRTTWQLQGLVNGQRYYFVVRAYDTAGLMSPKSVEVETHVLSVLLTSNITSQPAVGQAIRWIASSSAPAEYRFWRFSSGTWTIVQDYSALNTYTWTPTTGDLGDHSVQVWARVIGSPRDYNAWETSGAFTVGNDPIVIGSLESSVALPGSTGTAMTWKARALGGPAPLEYKFWRYKQASGWTMVQAFSTRNTYTWTPGPGDEGDYSLQVWVRPRGSTADYTAWRGTSFEIFNMPPAIGSIVSNVGFPAGSGTAITWRAIASGGPGLEYKFWRWSQASGAWTVLQNYSPSNTATWTPLTGDVGTHSLQVWVRRAGSTEAYEAWKGLAFTIANSTPTIRSLRPDRALPIGSGTPVTWRADAVGGPGPFEYKFWRYSQSTDSWSALTAYGPSDSYTWIPSAADEGNFVVQAWIRRQGSTAANPAAYLSTQRFTVTDATPSISAVNRDVVETTAGMPVTWTAVAGGGPGPLEYQFWRYDVSRQTWSIAQEYSWDNTFSWVPKPSERGAYTIQVWVRRFGSATAYDGWMSASPFNIK